jgi:hypothetical protein
MIEKRIKIAGTIDQQIGRGREVGGFLFPRAFGLFLSPALA